MADSAGPVPFSDVALTAIKNLRLGPLPKDFPEDHAEAVVQFLVAADSPYDFRTKLMDGSYELLYLDRYQGQIRAPLRSP